VRGRAGGGGRALLGLAPDAETTTLYQQIRAGLPAAGGVLWSMPGPGAAAGHNLPAQATPFVGREQELEEVRARLQDPACRLLTLLGPGGAGKTRLALQAAEGMVQAGSFEHGVFFCPLASITCCQGLVPAVAEALSYQFRPEIAVDEQCGVAVHMAQRFGWPFDLQL
jgi:hypothetical protein